MRPGPGLVVMALAFISGARRGSTSTSQQTLSSLTSSSSSLSSSSSSYSSSSLSSSSSSSKSSLLFPSNEYHYFQQQLPPEQRSPSDRRSPYSSSYSSSSSSSSSYNPSSFSPSDTSPSALSSSHSLFHSFGSSDTSVVPQHSSSSSSSTSSLSSDYRNSFTIYNFDRNNDDIKPNYHFDNFKLDKISYVNIEDYGENIEKVGIIGLSGDSGVSGGGDGDGFEDDDRFFVGTLSHSHIFESTSSLSRVNPWLSACDLAQPSSAPDLQGQCTAGSLPVAWVDEGPGPPMCPQSCEQLRLENNNNYNSNTNSNSNNNKLHISDNNYLINMNNNNNFNPVNNIMSKVRREITGSAASATAKTTTIASNNAAATKGASPSHDSSQGTTIKPPGVVERTTTTVSTASMNANKMVADKTVETQSNHHQGMQSDSQSLSTTQDHQHNSNNFNNNINLNLNKYNNNIVKNNLNTINNVNTNNNDNDNNNQYNQNQQQQQCLDYLGDNDDSSPTQLCKNSRSDLANKLRTLRLKHCCERTVFSALHTIALNATLGGGPHCVRILTDILDLDILATRITCELAEILFRYDCRQIYSLKHQCKDCKEAYRRWVCSTLIPYFADRSSTSNANAKDSATTTTNTAATSNSTNNNNNNKQPDNTDKYSLNNNDENFERDKSHRHSLSVYDDEESAESPKISPLSSSSALSITSLTLATMAQHQHHHQQQKQQEQQEHEQPTHLRTKNSQDDTCKRTKSNSRKTSNIDERGTSDTRQSEDSISTANNEDPCVEDPVISRLLKRTKRKVEFRKRRRIRPCLSVCQTVEQKCPYLLPGDRAPAYPTQYAGEPTFLCLDQNIPETGEQLLKSNHGPPECCYRYCDPPEHGICTYCDDFDDGSGTKSNTTAAVNHPRNTSTTLEDRLAPSSPTQDNSDLSSSRESLNTTATNVASSVEIAKLPYFAYTGHVYYYDDITDLPSEPVPECQPVASIHSKCTMPYYASSATRFDASSLLSQRSILVWSSIFWYLVNNYILVTVHNTNGNNYRFYYYCCYNLNDWWRRLIVLTMTVVCL